MILSELPIQMQNAIKRYKDIILTEIYTETWVDCWIAWWALRDYFNSVVIKTDYDVFFKSEEDFTKVSDYFKEKWCKVIWESENGKKVKYKWRTYDLVKKYFESPQATIDNFDFTVSMIAVSRTELVYHPTTFIDLAKRQLMINNLTYPASTMKRVLKYYEKWFRICNEELAKIVIAIQNTPVPDMIQEWWTEERTSWWTNRLFIWID